MKIIYVLLIVVSNILFGQVSPELLQAPASPASNLLGVANSEINKPTDVATLMVGLQNLSFNFIEKGSFSVDVAPYWISPNKSDKSISQMLTNKHSIPQTFVLSFAVKNIDEDAENMIGNSIYTAVGLKFSVLRGYANQETRTKHALLKKLLTRHSGFVLEDSEIDNIIDADNQLKRIKSKMGKMLEPAGRNDSKQEEIKSSTKYKILLVDMNNRIDSLKSMSKNAVEKSNEDYIVNLAEIQAIQKDFKIVRTGFLLDFAGGTSIQFKEKRFNNSKIYNAGVWTVLGYATEKSGTPLLLVRYMYNPKSDWMTVEDFKPEGNFSTFDAGVKYEYSPKDSKFTGSLEGLYRSFISGSDLKPTWKCVLNLDYAIFANQHLTLSLGKDFDNNIIKKGNVIAGLSFLSGIGTKRKIQ
ncbi:hypothetical protein J3D55_000898 [Chryseobacterium ginsenosidimutans]|uniref:hypothetical protein n=1 Tax=Chryseobacterium ginsenosidimutans TaxID=687846 RepID=UPI0021676618|nr:hypothetical protein [Chryseobacterium ginsenosidimutans]MCS3867982.1 hypothetical protein [Chryseobacterium ginsenosidimutans]